MNINSLILLTLFTLSSIALNAQKGEIYAKEIQETTYLVGSSFTETFPNSAVNFIPDKDSNRKGECLLIFDPQQNVEVMTHISITGRYVVRDDEYIDISKVRMNGQVVEDMSIIIQRQDNRHSQLITYTTDGSEMGLIFYLKRNGGLSNNKAVFAKETSNSGYRVGRTFTQLWRIYGGQNTLTFTNTPGSNDSGRIELNFLGQIYAGTFKVRNGSIIDVNIETFNDHAYEGSMTIVRTSDKFLQAQMKMKVFEEEKAFHFCFVKQ